MPMFGAARCSLRDGTSRCTTISIRPPATVRRSSSYKVASIPKSTPDDGPINPLPVPGQQKPRYRNVHLKDLNATVDVGPINLPPIPGQKKKPISRKFHLKDLNATVDAHHAANQRKVQRQTEGQLPGRPQRVPDEAAGHGSVQELEDPGPEDGPAIQGYAVRDLPEPLEVQQAKIVDTGIIRRHVSGNYLELGRIRKHTSERSLFADGRIRKHVLKPDSTDPAPPRPTGVVKDDESERSLSNSSVLECGVNFEPWTRLIRHEANANGIIRLTAEIKAFGNFIGPTRSEQRATEALIYTVTNIVKTAIKGCQTSLHGSRATGLDGPLSDINISMFPAALRALFKNRSSHHTDQVVLDIKLETIEKLRKAFEHYPQFAGRVTSKPHVPYLRLHDQRTGLNVKLDCDESHHAREVTLFLRDQHPQAVDLLRTLRQALTVQDWTHYLGWKSKASGEGGLTSYHLFVMIMGALNLSPVRYRRQESGAQLLEVLRFWGEADLVNSGFAVDPARTFDKYRKKNKNARDTEDGEVPDSFQAGIELIAARNWADRQRIGPYKKPGGHNAKVRGLHDRPRAETNLLCLQNPASPGNDLGRSVNFTKRMQAFFRHKYSQTQLAIDAWNDRNTPDLKPSERSQGPSILSALVGSELQGSKYWEFVAARERLAAAAEGLSGDDFLVPAFRLRGSSWQESGRPLFV